MKKSGFLFVAAAVALASAASAQVGLTWVTQTDNLKTLPLLENPSVEIGSNQMHGTAVVTVAGTTYVYMVGGNAPLPGELPRIHYAPIVGNTVGAWQAADVQLTNAAGALGGANLAGVGTSYATRSTVGLNGRIYQVGGRSNVGDVDNRNRGIRVFTPVAGGNIPASNVEYYTGLADATNSIAAVSPVLERLESAVVTNPSKAVAGQTVLYIAGGGSGAEATSSIQKLYIDNSTGAIVGAGPLNANTRALGNAITTAGALDAAKTSGTALILGDYFYYIGSNVAPRDVVLRGTIGNDDNVGTLAAAGVAALPEGRFDGGAVVYNNRIYVLGGCVTGNTDIRNTVYYAEPNLTTGDIATWQTGNPIPITHPVGTVTPGLRRVGAVTSNNLIIIVAGRVANTDAPTRSGDVFVGRDTSAVSDWQFLVD